MKSDKQIQKDVMEQLDFDPAIDSQDIGVSVKDRIVMLSGSVPNYYEKYAAEKRALQVAGVKSVVEDIRISLPGIDEYSDYDIAKAAADALEWNSLVPSTVKASVQDGIVTLRGETEWAYQKESAEASVRLLKGVKGVSNVISLSTKAQPKPEEVKESIKRALIRSAEVDADNIKVTVADHTVILSGHVRTADESAEARWAAWAMPGITRIDNQLVIG